MPHWSIRNIVVCIGIGNVEIPQFYDNASILRITGPKLIDPSQLFEDGEQTFDIADDLWESTRRLELLKYLALYEVISGQFNSTWTAVSSSTMHAWKMLNAEVCLYSMSKYGGKQISVSKYGVVATYSSISDSDCRGWKETPRETKPDIIWCTLGDQPRHHWLLPNPYTSRSMILMW